MLRIASLITLLLFQLFSTGSAQLRPAKVGSLYGFKDSTGKIVIQPAYDDVHYFYEGLVCVRKDGLWGFINEEGKTVIDFKYRDNGYFQEGLAPIKGQQLYGVINRCGDTVIPFKYSWISAFGEGVSGVTLNNVQQLIDSTGKTLLDSLPYDDVGRSEDGMIDVKKNGLMGFIKRYGKVIVPPMYGFAPSSIRFSEGLCALRKDDRAGFIDTTGKVIVPFEYDDAFFFSNGLAAVRLKGKWGYINRDNKFVIPVVYDEVNPFYAGKAQVTLNGIKSHIDQLGKPVGPAEKIVFDYVGELKEGLKCVNVNRSWGFADEAGNIVIPMAYQYARDFHEGVACVKIKGHYGFIDKQGRIVVSAIYDQAGDFHDGQAIVVLYGDRKGIRLPDAANIRAGYTVPNAFDLPPAPTGKSGGATARTCSVCNGQGKVVKPIQRDITQDSYGNWYKIVGTQYETCPFCKGARTL